MVAKLEMQKEHMMVDLSVYCLVEQWATLLVAKKGSWKVV